MYRSEHASVVSYIVCYPLWWRSKFRSLCLLAAVLLLLSHPAHVQAQGIALDAVTTSAGGDRTTDTWNHTVGSGSNRLLIVGVSHLNAPSSTQVLSVTYNSVNLTQVGTVSNGSQVTAEIWRLVNPPEGTHQVKVTLNTSDKQRSAAASFFNVDQTTPVGTFFQANSVSTSASVLVTSVAEGEVVIDTLATKNGNSITATVGAGQTQRWNVNASSDVKAAGSTEPSPAGGGTVTMSWGLDSSIEWAFGTVALKPANPTAVTLRSFSATRHQGGILLHWRTGLDVNNLGWHVYREVDGKRVPLTPELIAGSALMFGPETQLNAGNSYKWWDPAGLNNDRYWIRDRDISGKHTWHGPVMPVATDALRPKKRHSILLSKVGQQQTLQTKTRTRRAQYRSGRTVRHLTTSSQTRQPWEYTDLQPPAVQYALAAAPAIKLDIWETGWYRVTQPELVTAGLSPNVDPRTLQLFAQGQQQPIRVTGKDDSRFAPQDAIEFYGMGLDTPHTDTQTYWIVAGSQLGKRVQLESSQIQGTAAPSSFPATLEHKERSLYLAIVKNGDAENFFGAVIAKEAVDRVLSVHHLSPSPPADTQLEIVLQGVTLDSHQVAVQLNGHEVGTMGFSGQTREAATFSIPQGWLQDGDNVVTLVPTGHEDDVIVVDRIRLTYWHAYTAHNDSLRFTVPSHSQVTITGFSQPGIRVVDITAPLAIRQLVGTVAAQGTSYAVTVTADRDGERTLLAFADTQVKQPAAIRTNVPSTWNHLRHAADLVIMSHEAFLESVTPLKTVRESQGWRVALVDTQDAYDEFNYGHKSPGALQDFLHRAHTAWQTPPRFVLLVGDTSFDSRDYLGLGDVDFVPTKLVETAFLETASDDALVDFGGDGVPDLAVGRLPVQTVQEAKTVVAKLVNYAKADISGTWTREALFVADDNDIFDFTEASTDVAALLSSDLTVEELFLGQTDAASLRSDLLTHLNEGQLLVNYIGHGSTEVWGRGELLTSADARALTNGERLPVFVAMNCLNGFFHDLYTESLAETLLKAEQGGAIAVWASSGLTSPHGQAVINQELMRALFGEEQLTLGEAIIRAKSTLTDRDVQRTWILFGDPTLRLPSAASGTTTNSASPSSSPFSGNAY